MLYLFALVGAIVMGALVLMGVNSLIKKHSGKKGE